MVTKVKVTMNWQVQGVTCWTRINLSMAGTDSIDTEVGLSPTVATIITEIVTMRHRVVINMA